jgi:small GTP-binding protein
MTPPNSNQVSELEPLQNLNKLTNLNFSENQVNELPVFFRDFKKLDFLFLRENKFEVGEEIYNLDSAEQIEAILQWQASRARQDLRPISEAKIMFIGDSKKGKTHLIEMLLKGAFRPKIPTTHGIERHRLPYVTCPQGAVRVNVWDLGGQQFMRSTHQYFFTERTLYVLVAEAREERKDLNHWLQLAKEIGKESPVLVVVNKIDLDPHDLDRASLQTDYPNICDFVRTSIHDKPEAGIVALDTIQALREKIGAIVTDPRWMPDVYAERPSEWFTVKEGEVGSIGEKRGGFYQLRRLRKVEAHPQSGRSRAPHQPQTIGLARHGRDFRGQIEKH